MFEKISAINALINSYIWGIPSMIFILGIGIFFTIKCNYIQIIKFPHAMKMTLGKIFTKQEKTKDGITPFQAVCTALAATFGTGNIAGVAGAITIGGPGAIFWMWLSALLGMCIKFVEVTLAVIFREKNKEGEYVGGPMYSIKNGLNPKWLPLSYIFSLLCIFASFGIGNAVQVNTIASSFESIFNLIKSPINLNIFKLILGIVLTILVATIMIGGIKRLANITDKLIPFMAIMYTTLSLGVIIANINFLPNAFRLIFTGAFNPSAVTGGLIGSVIKTISKGFSRGIFSNEAGLGSASIAHSSTNETNPIKQGLWGIFEVFIDTIVLCTLTSLVILCGTKGIISYGVDQGIELTLNSFINVYGSWIIIPITISLCCFAFATILGWGYYGTKSTEYIFGAKGIKIYLLIFSSICIVGAMGSLSLIWDISDTINGLMMIPNLIATLLLSPKVFTLTKKYFNKQN